MRTGIKKQNIVENFVSRVDPYAEIKPLKFDLRKYAKYVKENKLAADKITPEVMQKFARGGDS